MNRLLIIIFLLFTLSATAQKSLTKEIEAVVAEGKLLYKSEMASWYGSDLFFEKYKDLENIGGYFSYVENDLAKCIFYSKADQPRAIGTITFDTTYNLNKATLDLSERALTPYEFQLYMLRKLASIEIMSDTMFKTFENANLNIIPLINGKERKVYVITGPQQNGVILLGNDYLLTFNKNNKLTFKKKLHNNLIPFYYGEMLEDGGVIEESGHSHTPVSGDLITATDICTIMLYGKFASWKSHNVISKKYLSIWNCETNKLAVIPMSTIEKINKDQEKRNGVDGE